jgi:DNA polymerase II small subunit
MSEIDPRLKQVINMIVKSGYQLDADALLFLRTLDQDLLYDYVKKIIQELATSSEKPLFLTREFFEVDLAKTKKLEATSKEVQDNFAGFQPYAKEITEKLEVLDDSANREGIEGNIENYLNYFRDRFSKIERILRERIDVKDAISINTALKAPLKSKVKIIGIVIDKRERKRVIFIQVEDNETNLTILVPFSSDRTLFDKTRRLLVDQVVCIEITKIEEGVFIAKDIISPDIPERRPNTSADQIYVALTSDIHIGSKKFLSDAFEHFIEWLKCSEGNSRQREIAGRVKYLVIAGDIVDGIGVYPGQERELAITDVYEQYNLASKLIERIPEYIEIIIIPGNHDATRQALPQPAILKKYAEELHMLNNVTMLGDPARIRLHGVNLTLYHGRSLDDIIGSVPEVTYLNLSGEITRAMEYLLKTRHLAPIYGSKTPIAPTSVDELVIETPPDVLHTGHVHVLGYKNYRGTFLVNSGTWQAQTEYQ